ncbi:hypothetical protein L207DRAFT_570325 [Hyaloscypha variabilis F]|uniref:2EXR domain-containing protein n=1 Tax=Hyaloscypha variabilis (strain UAMH 11265 / GT02V1 / F) TaxID=1149755 RepID=A0A2J6R815_HYAVF|nr:hypothetical protein L207DRAFT_570325 [Hyaloscypha variabilis F]
MAPREKGAARPKANPTPITAGGRRPTRVHRPIERFIPGLPPSPSSSRSRKTPPGRPVPYSGPPLVIRLRVSTPANPGSFTNQVQPSNFAAPFNDSPTSDLQLSTNANNPTPDLQSPVNAANPTTDLQLSSKTANPTTSIGSSSKAPNGPLTNFGLFPKLPAELRHMVWKRYLPGPRIIEIQFDPDHRKHGYKFATTNPLPFLLRVCHEAREFFLLRYKRYAFNHPRCTNGCYFNFEQDILSFQVLSAHKQRSRWLTHPDVTADVKNVKNLAFTHVELWKDLNGEEKPMRPLPLPTFLNFDRVQKVLVVFIVRHTAPCSFCLAGRIPPKDQEFLDDLKERVSNFKDDLEGGKMYCFMFGKEWKPPQWEWLTQCCQNMQWRRTYLKSLEPAQAEDITDKPARRVMEGVAQVNEVTNDPAGGQMDEDDDESPGEPVARAARIEDVANKPAGDLMEGLVQMNEIADEAAGEQIELDAEELPGEHMVVATQLEEVRHKSPEDTMDDDTVGGSESSEADTLRLMDMEGETLESISWSEAASITGFELEDLRDGD